MKFDFSKKVFGYLLASVFLLSCVFAAADDASFGSTIVSVKSEDSVAGYFGFPNFERNNIHNFVDFFFTFISYLLYRGISASILFVIAEIMQNIFSAAVGGTILWYLIIRVSASVVFQKEFSLKPTSKMINIIVLAHLVNFASQVRVSSKGLLPLLKYFPAFRYTGLSVVSQFDGSQMWQIGTPVVGFLLARTFHGGFVKILKDNAKYASYHVLTAIYDQVTLNAPVFVGFACACGRLPIFARFSNILLSSVSFVVHWVYTHKIVSKATKAEKPILAAGVAGMPTGSGHHKGGEVQQSGWLYKMKVRGFVRLCVSGVSFAVMSTLLGVDINGFAWIVRWYFPSSLPRDQIIASLDKIPNEVVPGVFAALAVAINYMGHYGFWPVYALYILPFKICNIVPFLRDSDVLVKCVLRDLVAFILVVLEVYAVGLIFNMFRQPIIDTSNSYSEKSVYVAKSVNSIKSMWEKKDVLFNNQFSVFVSAGVLVGFVLRKLRYGYFINYLQTSYNAKGPGSV